MKHAKIPMLMASLSPVFALTACKWGTEERIKREGFGEARFGEYDGDRDGFLNEDEFRRYLPDSTKNFETIDVDRDKRVSEDEFRRFGERDD